MLYQIRRNIVKTKKYLSTMGRKAKPHILRKSHQQCGTDQHEAVQQQSAIEPGILKKWSSQAVIDELRTLWLIYPSDSSRRKRWGVRKQREGRKN